MRVVRGFLVDPDRALFPLTGEIMKVKFLKDHTLPPCRYRAGLEADLDEVVALRLVQTGTVEILDTPAGKDPEPDPEPEKGEIEPETETAAIEPQGEVATQRRRGRPRTVLK